MGPGMSGLYRLCKVLVSIIFVLTVGAAHGHGAEPVLISAQVEGTAEEVFRDLISSPIVQAKCVNCHVEGGRSAHTPLVFVREADTLDHLAFNLQVFADYLETEEGGHERILTRIQGVAHGGGVQAPVGSEDFDDVDYFLALLGGETAEDVFREYISGPIVQSKCVKCHVEGGESGGTRLVLVRSADAADHETLNLQRFEALLAAVEGQGGADYVLSKIQGMLSHSGGVQVPADSDDFDNMEHFLALLEDGPEGFVARLLRALEDGETSPMFEITTPMDADTVAGDAVTVSATGASTEAVHFAVRPADDAEAEFVYLGAAANRGAARFAWNTSARMDEESIFMDGGYELSALYTEDGAESVTFYDIALIVDNVEPSEPPDIAEDRGRKTEALLMDRRHTVVTADGVVVRLPPGVLDGDDRITITVVEPPDPATAPGEAVGLGTPPRAVDVALASGQNAFPESVTIEIPYPEGRPDGIVEHTSIPETELSMWFFDAQAGAWMPIPGSRVEPGADVVVAGVDQTGQFGIFHARQACQPDGDVDQSGDVTAADALLAFQQALGLADLDACQFTIADVFPLPSMQDGDITASDALCIFQKALSLPSCLD